MHIPGLKIGHAEDKENQTGVTVFLFDRPVKCGYHRCGSAPALRDVTLLDPDTRTGEIHALVFTGGSAFGPGVTNAVMEWLEEKGQGLVMPHRIIPLVPAAAIYDFDSGRAVAPAPELARQACENAGYDYTGGRRGAGCGASAGKAWQYGTPEPAGTGLAVARAGDTTMVSVAVVNAVGDVYKDNRIIAGARDGKGNFVNLEQRFACGEAGIAMAPGQNTVLVANFIDAAICTKELIIISRMATAGIARAIRPAFTPFDGDIVFSAATGTLELTRDDTLSLGTVCARNVEQAIVNSVSINSTELPAG